MVTFYVLSFQCPVLMNFRLHSFQSVLQLSISSTEMNRKAQPTIINVYRLLSSALANVHFQSVYTESKDFPKNLRELLQALALAAVLTLQTLKVGTDLSQLQLHLGVTTGVVKWRHTQTCSGGERERQLIYSKLDRGHYAHTFISV